MNSWVDLLWTTPVLIGAAIVIGWGAETAQIYISQGLALAILAWLQTAPEFAVEAVVAWHQRLDLMLANLTGSLRLLLGFGWPLIYFTWVFLGGDRHSRKGKAWPVIRLKAENSLEVFILLLATLYFCLIWFKGSLTVADGGILASMYFLYLFQLSKLPKGEHEDVNDLPKIGKKITRLSPAKRNLSIIGLFALGALGLKFSVEPFLHSLESVALLFGISSFFFIQWCAPFVSEFPEKVTAFQWARHGKKVRLALMNMVGSNIVQWTVMAAMLPVILSVSKKAVTPVFFDPQHEEEILITVAQSFLSILFLMDLEISFSNALGLLVLWAIQFIVPHWRIEVIYVYGLWSLFEIFALIRKGKLLFALDELRRINQARRVKPKE